MTPQTAESLPRTMQSLGRRYVRNVNALYRRTGTLWEGRYCAAPVDSEEYFVACCRYIELNPVRARMVAHPRQYRWSSYRAHAEGADDPLARFHDASAGSAAASTSARPRALVAYEPGLRAALKPGGFLARDPRAVERKKYGKPKARRSFQFSKR